MPEERDGLHRDEDKLKSDLDDAIEGVSKLTRGLAGKLLGPKAGEAEGTVVNEDFDAALDEVGSTLGSLLSAAGEAMKEHSTAPDEALEATVEKVQQGHKAQGAEGWSPLVHGASTFAEGLGKLSAGFLDSLVAKDLRSGPTPEAEE